jgi:polyisoprenoid-binding protein YceI
MKLIPHKTISVLLFALILWNPLPSSAERVSYNLITDKSSLSWTGEKVTGSHNGILSVKSGEAIIENNTLVGGSFELAMGTIKNLDIEDPKYNKKLTDHLLSADFFNALEFPVARFVITTATPLKEPNPDGTNYTITGDLTIKGLTAPITFPAKVTLDGKQALAQATTKVDRTAFNIRYGSGKFFENLGDKLIYDMFTVSCNLVSERS